MRKYNISNIEASYKFCPIASNVQKALVVPLRRFAMLKNYVLVIDDEENEVILMFPLNDINRVDRKLKDIVFDDLIANFKKAGLNLKEQKGIIKDVYRVGFIPIIFKITSI